MRFANRSVSISFAKAEKNETMHLALFGPVLAGECVYTVEGKTLDLELEKAEMENCSSLWWEKLLEKVPDTEGIGGAFWGSDLELYRAESEGERVRREQEKRMVRKLDGKIGEQTLQKAKYTGKSGFAW